LKAFVESEDLAPFCASSADLQTHDDQENSKARWEGIKKSIDRESNAKTMRRQAEAKQ